MILETPIKAKRKVRDARIKSLFQEYMALPESMKTSVIDRVAAEVEVSVTTVNRVIK